MFHSSLWRRLALAVALMLLVAMSLSRFVAPPMAQAASSTVTISPNTGLPGTQVTGSGANWTAGDSMQVSWGDNGSILANTTVQSNGTFTVVFKIPSSAGTGGHNIYFTDLNSRYFLSQVFTVDTVIVQKVWTADNNNNATTSFVSAGAIHYMVAAQNASSTSVTATVTFLATGPQRIYYWSGPASLASGPSSFYSAPTIPSDAPAGTYTITVTITYNGVSSSGQSNFTVRWRDRVSSNPYPDSSQCTWFAEEKMNSAVGLYMPNFGDAHAWRDNAPPHGWTVGTTPETASVLIMQYADANGNPYKYWYWNGSQWVQTYISKVGHVGWVTSIGNNGSSVYVVDRNWNLNGQDGGRWIWISGAPVNFIYSLR